MAIYTLQLALDFLAGAPNIFRANLESNGFTTERNGDIITPFTSCDFFGKSIIHAIKFLVLAQIFL